MIFDFFKRDVININAGDYFSVECKNKHDPSWSSATFVCIERDYRRLVGQLVSKESKMFYDAVVTFSKRDWNFYPVSAEFLSAQLSAHKNIKD